MTEIGLARFYSQAPRPLVFSRADGRARLAPVDSFMVPVMQWANVAPWRRGGAHRGKALHLPSAARIRKLEDEAEEYLQDIMFSEEEETDMEEKAIRSLSGMARNKKVVPGTKSARSLRKKGFKRTKKADRVVVEAKRTAGKKKRTGSKLKRLTLRAKAQTRFDQDVGEKTPFQRGGAPKIDDFTTPPKDAEQEANKVIKTPGAPIKARRVVRKRVVEPADPYDLSASENDSERGTPLPRKRMKANRSARRL